MRAYLRSLNPQLSRDVWILQAGGLANMFGNGVIGPFLIIYLHNVRGISLGVAGPIDAAQLAHNAGATPCGVRTTTYDDEPWHRTRRSRRGRDRTHGQPKHLHASVPAQRRDVPSVRGGVATRPGTALRRGASRAGPL